MFAMARSSNANLKRMRKHANRKGLNRRQVEIIYKVLFFKMTGRDADEVPAWAFEWYDGLQAHFATVIYARHLTESGFNPTRSLIARRLGVTYGAVRWAEKTIRDTGKADE